MTVVEALKAAAVENLDARIEHEFFPFLRIPTVSHPDYRKHDEIVRGAEYLKKMMEARGIETEIVPNTPHPFVVGRLRGEYSHLPAIVHYCHFDIQPASMDDPGEIKWESHPFEPTVREEAVRLFNGNVVSDRRIYARGSVDDKGPLMTHLWAIEGYLRTGHRLPRDLVFVFEGTEEIGDEGGLEAHIKAHAEEWNASVVTMFDSIALQPGAPFITTSLRGVVLGNITVTTGKKISHSGIYPGTVVPNPLWLVNAIVHALRDQNGGVNIEGFYDGMRELTADERAYLRTLPYDEGDYLSETGARFLVESPLHTYERSWYRPTIELHHIKPVMDGTMIPPYATAKLSMRIVEGQDQHRVAKAFENAVKSIARSYGIPDVCLEVKTNPGYPSFKQEKDHPQIRLMDEALRTGYGVETLHYIGCGGSIPQAIVFKENCGCPVIVTGIAEPGSNYHANRENVLVNNGLVVGIRSHIEFYERIRAADRRRADQVMP